MANYASLKAAVQEVIKTNGNNEITGALLQQSLLAMINSLGVGYQYAGIATPQTNPGTPDQNVFYIASESGVYSNFGGLTVYDGELAILKYNGTWTKEVTGYSNFAQILDLYQKCGGVLDITNTLSFEQGGISTANGTNQTSNLQIRSGFIVAESLSLSVLNGSVYIYGWHDSTYLSAVGWETGGDINVQIAGANRYKVVFKRNANLNLSPSQFRELDASVTATMQGEMVKFIPQSLTDAQKQQARENIGAEVAGKYDAVFFGGYAQIDTSNVQEESVYIYSNNKYLPADGINNKTKSKFLPIIPGQQYKIQNNVANESFFTILKDIDNIHVSSGTPHWATGYNSRVAVPVGGSVVIDAPGDGYYMYLLCKNKSGINYELSVYQYHKSLDDFETETNERLAALENGGSGGEKTSLDDIFESIVLPLDANGYEIPTNFGMCAALKKAAQGSQIKYNAKRAYPTLTDPTGESAGEKTGFPYSSVKEMAKFIHWHVSERTFMTAINNEYGLFYTEDVAGNNSRSDYGYTYHGVNCGPYYGMVCNIFALWCLGYPVPFDTTQFAYLATKGVLVKLNNQTAQNVHICDLVWYEGHTALITSVKHDEYGNVTEVKITESMGRVHTTTFTASEFDTYLHITHDAILYRPTFVYKNTYHPSEFVGVRGEATPSAYDYNDDICFFAGDYAAWKLGDNAWVNYTKGSFTGMKIYKGNTLVTTITLDNNSSIHKVNVTSYINGAGNYKACLTDGVNDSDFTYWQMVAATASYTNGVVSFESANGTPWYIQVCSSNGSAYCWYEITQDDINNGYATLDLAAMISEQYGTVSGTKYVRVAFKTEYGGVVSDMIQI